MEQKNPPEPFPEPLVSFEGRYPELFNDLGEPIGAISHAEIFTIKDELCFDSHFQFFEWCISMHLGA